MHQTLGSADIHIHNSNSFISIKFRQAAQHNAKSDCHHQSSQCSSNPSVSELHMMQAEHSKKRPATEDRSQDMHKSCYCCGATPSHAKKECPTRDAECYKYGKKGYFKCSCRAKQEEKGVGTAKNVKRKQKPAKVHELKAQATVGT